MIRSEEPAPCIGEGPEKEEEFTMRLAADSNHMNKQMKAHEEEKHLLCPVCGKRYKLKVKEHIRTHTDERPYTCSICGRGFNTCTTMRKHAKLKHMEDLPYKCIQRFHLRVGLGRHLKLYEILSDSAGSDQEQNRAGN